MRAWPLPFLLLLTACGDKPVNLSGLSAAPTTPPAPRPHQERAAVRLSRRRLVWPDPPAPIDPPAPGFTGVVPWSSDEGRGLRVFEGGVLRLELTTDGDPGPAPSDEPTTLWVGTILSVWGATQGEVAQALGITVGDRQEADYAVDPMGATESDEAYVAPTGPGGEVLVVFGDAGCGELEPSGAEGDRARALLVSLSARFGPCALVSSNRHYAHYWGWAAGGEVRRFVATGGLSPERYWIEGEADADEGEADLGLVDPHPAAVNGWLQRWRARQGAVVDIAGDVALAGPGLVGAPALTLVD